MKEVSNLSNERVSYLKISMQVNLNRSSISFFHSLQEQLPTKKMEEAEKEILETFRKVEVNIPLLDAIK